VVSLVAVDDGGTPRRDSGFVFWTRVSLFDSKIEAAEHRGGVSLTTLEHLAALFGGAGQHSTICRVPLI
jgi:hypothetical protein